MILKTWSRKVGVAGDFWKVGVEVQWSADSITCNSRAW